MKILGMLPAAKGVYPPEEEERRMKCIRSYTTATIQVDADYLPAVSGFVPYGARGTMVDVTRAHLLGAQRAVQAEQEGYDAFIPLGMVDVGVELARHVVKIICVGPCEATYQMAGLMARRVGVITYQFAGGLAGMRQRLQPYGADRLVVYAGDAGMPNSEMAARKEEMKQRFVACAKEAIAEGAELIVAHGATMCPVLYSTKELAEEIGVPVLEGMGCAVAMAQAWYLLGTPYSRVRYPHTPR